MNGRVEKEGRERETRKENYIHVVAMVLEEKQDVAGK